MRGLYEKLDELLPDSHRADTLVIYVYSKSDTEYQRNLEFFVRNGMWEGDGCDYIIIVQQEAALFGSPSLPQLPRNARYLFHENKCFDWGTFGWVFDETNINTDLYKSIIFMNSSVRGPFLPPYFPVGLHWSKLLTLRLSSAVKLVGSTISCEPAWEGGNTANEKRQNAHVQSYIMATDQVGLKALQDDGRVFACYDNMADTIYNAEVGASRIIFEQGYTIDSLMLKYQDVDWTNTTNWNCNAGLNPYAEFSYDGLVLNPLEVIFVKVKGFQVQGGWLSAQSAMTYDRWLSSEVAEGAANVNVYATKRMSFRLGRAITMQLRGTSCFDYNLYRTKSRDLPATLTDEQIWDHFVHDGQFEGRAFRFTCANPLDNPDIAERVFQEVSKHTKNILPAAETKIA
ncbi:g7276 [Coccomyxa elongata]